MDSKPSGLLRCTVFVLMLLEIQKSLVFSASTPPNCIEATKLADLLKNNAKDLLEEYNKFHGSSDYSIPKEVPESTISGTSISEKLQNINITNMLFQMHMSKVKEYQETVWGVQSNSSKEQDRTFWTQLSTVTNRLGHFLGTMKAVLETQVPEVLSPTSPPPLQVSYSNDYDIKAYGWAVLVRLEEWITEVLSVLPDVTGVCE